MLLMILCMAEPGGNGGFETDKRGMRHLRAQTSALEVKKKANIEEVGKPRN